MSDEQECLRVGYLCSQYPAASHTFIRREIVALRKRRVDIHIFTVRKTPTSQIYSEEDFRERETTWAILPTSPFRLLIAHAQAFLTRPNAYGRTFMRAFTNRAPGARASLWAVFYFGEAILLASELKRRGILHLHNHFANAGGDVGYLATQYLRIGWSVTLHGTADFQGSRTVLRKKLGAAKFVACASHYARAQAMWASQPKNWDQIIIVRCGMDFSCILPHDPVLTKSRRPRILNVGRLSSEKGQGGLIEAFASVVKSGIDAELVIVGEGPERARLENDIEERNLTDRIHLTGALAEDRVLEEMRQADLFVLTSFSEGLPVVLVEAMAVGIPVVAPHLAGIHEVVEDKVTGYLFNPGSWTELASILACLLSTRRRGESTIEKARLRVVSEFDVEKTIEPLLEKFREVIPSNSDENRSMDKPKKRFSKSVRRRNFV